MTANEMKDQFQLQYDGAKLGNRTFNDREVADFLNKSQQQLIKTRYDALKNRTQRGFSDTAIRQAELDGLISATANITNSQFVQGTRNNGALRGPNRGVDYNGTNAQEGNMYGVYAPLPDESLYILTENATTGTNVNINTAGTVVGSNIVYIKDNVPIQEINYLEYQSRIYDYYAKPYDNLVWSIGYGNWTPGVFNSTSGIFTASTKNGENITVSNQFNIAGYAPFGKTALNPLTYDIVANTYYVVKGSTGAANYVTYNSITYHVDEVFKGIAGITEFTLSGDATLQIANIINTRRSRYLLPGKSERGRLTGEMWHVLEYRVHYIKNPEPIFIDTVTPALQVDCQLADFLHQEVVDLAVKLASAAILPEQNKYQVNDIEAKINE